MPAAVAGGRRPSKSARMAFAARVAGLLVLHRCVLGIVPRALGHHVAWMAAAAAAIIVMTDGMGCEHDGAVK
jgi:hypothetical protein